MYDINQSLFMRSLRHESIERKPVWLMRQAGRYLPEYRRTRAQAGDFLQLCKNPELACEVTLQPLQRYGLDAAILFSDILTIPDAMGLGLSFVEGEGPCFSHPLREVSAIKQLPVLNIEEDLDYVMQAVQLIRQAMPKHLPLIGFAGSPWTLACYMIEGKSSRNFKDALCFMYEQHEAMHSLLEKLTQAIVAYLQGQIRAGVNVVMLFDTWGGLLSSTHYRHFSLKYMQLITQQIKQHHPTIPVILFTKGGGQWLSDIVATGCDVVGVDWTVDLALARAQVGERAALQGNLDPLVLLTSPECIRREVKRVLDTYGPGSGLIFNLGHGITPDVPPEHVSVLVEAVHEFSTNV